MNRNALVSWRNHPFLAIQFVGLKPKLNPGFLSINIVWLSLFCEVRGRVDVAFQKPQT